MKKSIINISFLAFVGLVVLLSIWGPESLAEYKDKEILNVPYTNIVETAGKVYRYSLNSNEKIYILSKCLNNQIIPESDQSALTRSEAADIEYQELAGTYAFVVNHKGPSGKEITDEEIYETSNKGLDMLKELGILPDTVREVEAAAYDAVLYSAIDVLEPRNNVAVWKLNLSNSQKNANKDNRLIDAYIDADNGKIYEFYARTRLEWKDIDTDVIINKWSEYMGLTKPMPYDAENPLMETATNFKKYEFAGIGEEKTIVTIGYYEGINELFLKISK